MKPTQTGIAVALALVVVISFFVFPGLSPFKNVDVSGVAAVNELSMTIDQPTELEVTDVTAGSGTAAAKGDTITVHYVGTLTDGTIFDASRNHGDQGFSFTLGAGQVIRGWDEGLVGMKEGGVRKLVIPAALAYGDRAIGNVIPANSALLFEVELISVSKTAN